VSGASLIFLLALFAVLYLVMIRPQRARQQRQQHLLESVEPGDEVLTVGGLYGIVQSIDEEGDLVVEIADGIHVRIARRAVATVVKPEDEADEDDEHDAIESGDHDARRSAVTVPDDDASMEATQRRLFGKRR
jgi:preprotein translocase subunit YajC